MLSDGRKLKCLITDAEKYSIARPPSLNGEGTRERPNLIPVQGKAPPRKGRSRDGDSGPNLLLLP